MSKRFCQASENNKDAILAALKEHFADVNAVLEIGSGTGQHAVHFGPHLSHLHWQTSDVEEHHVGIQAWMQELPSPNVLAPIEFIIGEHPWPKADEFDGVFSANTAHIMPLEITRKMMEMVAEHLRPGGVFCLYGPFNVDGEYTSEGNRSFDAHLAREGCGGIRDIAELEAWVAETSLTLQHRLPMPANNFLLVWRQK